ncbi:MAG: aminotransferase class III-fold pyridoxal phosphate-dependent enzyme [Proteobacteria bacterium]|nr:aminotransferase class III-fold pyridoxal phosphate-dependent enzyme [Pseudomonadota bacterium]
MTMWPDPSSNSAQIYQRALGVLPGGISRLQTWNEPFPFYAKSGSGVHVTDEDGTVRVDFVNNFASLIHGHAHPVIVEAVCEAVKNGTCFALPTRVEVELAEILCERFATFEKVRYCNTGTEAVMLALKAARAYTDRPKIAKFEGAYHGMYDFAEVSLDSSPANWGNDPRSVPYARGTPRGVLEDVVVLPFNETEASERIIREHADQLAGILIDLCPSYMGFAPMSPQYVDMLHRVTKEIGAVLIADEVISIRLGYGGGQGRFGLEPDLTVAAKLIGGGFPVACVAGREKVMSVFDHSKGKPLSPSSGTFTANPIGLTAGVSAMRLLTQENFDRLEVLGERAREGIARTFDNSGFPGQVTGIGSMFQIHMTQRDICNHRSAYQSSEEAGAIRLLQRRMLERGFIISNRGHGFLSTPMNEDHVDALADATSDALREMVQ